MAKEKITIIFLALLALSLMFLLPAVSSENVCCEKTKSNAICQDTTDDNCAPGAQMPPTSCNQTSFCRLGTCIDNNEGRCKPNTPKKACDEINAYWNESDEEQIPQFQKVCCLLGGLATFVTKKECKTLSGLYGLETVYNDNIKNSLDCLASGVSENKGACVYNEEEDFGKTCNFLTEKECRDKKKSFPNLNVEFFPDYLCSAEELNTNCAPSKKTRCNNEKVYFVDTCGNLANIYDSTKFNDANYWKKIIESEDSCGAGASNKNSKTCGNCNYDLGSICSKVKTWEPAPSIGNYICRDLSCTYDSDGDGTNETYQHGERWCASGFKTSKITNKSGKFPDSFKENVPGSEYYILSCVYGEVDPDLCGDGARQYVCIGDSIYPENNPDKPFRNAKCSVNIWRDCIEQSTKDDCENIEKRDCKWIPALSRTNDNRLTTWKPRDTDTALLIKTDESLPRGIDLRDFGDEISDIIKNYILSDGKTINKIKYSYATSDNIIDYRNGACVPMYPPGFDFTGNITKINGMNNSNEAEKICSLANAVCVIKKEAAALGAYKSVENSECEPGGPDGYLWYESMKNICVSLGDCGASVNYIGEEGDKKNDLIVK